MSTIIPIQRRADISARVSVTGVVSDHLGAAAGDAIAQLLAALSVAHQDVEGRHRPEHVLALITSAYGDLVAAVQRWRLVARPARRCLVRQVADRRHGRRR